MRARRSPGGGGGGNSVGCSKTNQAVPRLETLDLKVRAEHKGRRELEDRNMCRYRALHPDVAVLTKPTSRRRLLNLVLRLQSLHCRQWCNPL